MQDFDIEVTNDPDGSGRRRLASWFELACPVIANQAAGQIQQSPFHGAVTGRVAANCSPAPQHSPAPNFYPGDIVQAIKSSAGGFTAGNDYAVKEYLPPGPSGSPGHMRIERDDQGCINGWSAANFVLVKHGFQNNRMQHPLNQPMQVPLSMGIDLARVTPHRVESECHCGCLSIGSNKHSDYCPLYERE